MSDSSAREFLNRLTSDKAYRAEIEDAIDSADGTLGSVVQRAARDGFDFTAGEIEAAMTAVSENELNDAELDKVAGGFNPQPTPPALGNPFNTFRNLLSGKFNLRF